METVWDSCLSFLMEEMPPWSFWLSGGETAHSAGRAPSIWYRYPWLSAIFMADNLDLIFIVVCGLLVEDHQAELFWGFKPWYNLRAIFNDGAYNTSKWLVVVFTMEHFVAIHTWRVKARTCSPWFAVEIVIAVSLFSHLCAAPYNWSKASVQENHTGWIYRLQALSHFIHTLAWFQTLQAYILNMLMPRLILWLTPSTPPTLCSASCCLGGSTGASVPETPATVTIISPLYSRL